jgi:hypothetical protein
MQSTCHRQARLNLLKFPVLSAPMLRDAENDKLRGPNIINALLNYCAARNN